MPRSPVIDVASDAWELYLVLRERVDQLARKLVRFADLTPEMRSTHCGDKDAGR